MSYKVSEPKERRKDQLQELYQHLDTSDRSGLTRMSWYGQLRAQEYTHDEAITMTLDEYRVRREPWYIARQRHAQERGEPMREL